MRVDETEHPSPVPLVLAAGPTDLTQQAVLFVQAEESDGVCAAAEEDAPTGALGNLGLTVAIEVNPPNPPPLPQPVEELEITRREDGSYLARVYGRDAIELAIKLRALATALDACALLRGSR